MGKASVAQRLHAITPADDVDEEDTVPRKNAATEAVLEPPWVLNTALDCQLPTARTRPAAWTDTPRPKGVVKTLCPDRFGHHKCPPRAGGETVPCREVKREALRNDSGFVRRSRDGSDFLLGSGKPARFWAVNDGAFNKDLARHARFLAKHGINMVRFHSNITPTGSDLMGIDAKDRDRLWRGVAAMKKEGIYVTYSPYWAGPARVKPSMGILDSGGNGNWGLLFFDRKLQEAYKSWMKQVLTERNPYTGLPPARDPALAVIRARPTATCRRWASGSAPRRCSWASGPRPRSRDHLLQPAHAGDDGQGARGARGTTRQIGLGRPRQGLRSGRRARRPAQRPLASGSQVKSCRGFQPRRRNVGSMS